MVWAPRGTALGRRPHRHETMTANDSTPETGQDSTEAQQDQWAATFDATNEELAHSLAETKQELRELLNRLDSELLNEGDIEADDVNRLNELGHRLRGYSAALSDR